MDVVLLGTGSADGWPNPFCRCASCSTQAAAHELRTPTSVLVDDRLLLDCGPEAPRAALRAGRRLDRLAAILLTHAHPDHSAPMALLSRAWAHRTDPLVIAGPASALDLWKPWSAPDAPIRWQPLDPGDAHEIDGYVIRAVPAAHDQPALLYLVEDHTGQRLFYGADTGPLLDQAVRALAARPVDVLLLEETFGDRDGRGTGHHDLGTFGRELARLREAGGLREDARVVAVHLGHHNPPEPRLSQRLAAWGARAGRDGEAVTVPTPSPTANARRGRTLLIGGARSGKSTAAERLLGAEPHVTYLAPGPTPDGSDPEWDERVRHHRERRPASWVTVETTDAATVLRAATTPLLVDCLGTWLAGVLTDAGAWDGALGWEARAQERVDDLLAAWREATVPVVAVSNEVGSGVVPAHVSGIVFRDWLGRLNQAVAAASERVLLIVAGRVVELS